MTELTLHIESDNAAFDDDPRGELARILAIVTDCIADGAESGVCYDINGNNVGDWVLWLAPPTDEELGA